MMAVAEPIEIYGRPTSATNEQGDGHPSLAANEIKLHPPLCRDLSSSSSSSSSVCTSPSTSSPSVPPLVIPPPPAQPSSKVKQEASSEPATSPNSWEQQLARLNSLTQMTSQIASIALEKTASQPQASTQETKADLVVEWVSSISRSLQTELQSVYATLHNGTVQQPTSLASPTRSSSNLSQMAPSQPLPSLPPPLLPILPVEISLVPTPATSPSFQNGTDDPEHKKPRRRRKPKTKDNFNHMQRRCANCQRTETAKWRNGPLGSNTLCNTCGLAYSRKKKREEMEQAKQNQGPAPS